MANSERIPGQMNAKLLIAIGLLGLCGLTFAQEKNPDLAKTLVKKTTAGVEVTLFQAAASTDIDPVNRVPQFRMGACPPGAVLGDMRIQGDRNTDVIVVLIGLRFGASYHGPDFVTPFLIDAAGKEYSSRNMFDAPKGMATALQKTGEQIKCEVPFEIPKGIQPTKLKYDDAIFELKDLFQK